MFPIEIPSKPLQILETLKKAGYEGYLVGGCVRDALLGKQPSDWDITTNADPDTLRKLFPSHTDVGAQFGTVVALIGGEEYEITSFRKEAEYSDGRHPDKIEFADTLEEDLSRRDFTINAMAFSPDKGLIDPFGGQKDLESKVVRCVGNPNDRFSEDALRMLRAIRFSASLGFEIDKDTYQAIINNHQNVYKLSPERVQKELVKTLMSENPDKIKLWTKTGLSEILMPELYNLFQTRQNNPHHIYNAGDHTMHALKNSAPIKEVRLAVLFHDFGKAKCSQIDENGIDHFHGHAAVSEIMTKDIMKSMHFDNKTIDTVSKLVLLHENRFPATDKSVRKFLSANGKEMLDLLLEVQKADIYGQAPLPSKKTELLAIAEKYQIAKNLSEKEGQISIKSLAINGNDLKEMGFEGKEIGRMLQSLLETVLSDPGANTKENLTNIALEQKNADFEHEI